MIATSTAPTTRERVRALRAEGLGFREISERLGVNYSYVRRCGAPRAYDLALQQSRISKREVVGKCERCGAPTGYAGHRQQRVSRFCIDCGQIVSAERMKERAGTGPNQRRILAILDRPRRYSEIRDLLGMGDNLLMTTLVRLRHLGLVERPKRGIYVRTEA